MFFYVFRSVTLTFEPGQTSLQTSVTILDDVLPEDSETFYVTLVSPRMGAEIGDQREVTVHILSNDNGHGIIEFAQVRQSQTYCKAVQKF